MGSDFTRIFSPKKSSTKASEDPVCWVIIAGHLEQTFHRQNWEKVSTVTHYVTYILSAI